MAGKIRARGARRWGWRVPALLVAVTVMLTGCGLFEPTHTYRFRMTVEAETPQGPRSGSSVMQVSAQKAAKLTSEAQTLRLGLNGEAVVLDLPSGPVFVLLAPKQSGDRPLQAIVTNALTEGRAYSGDFGVVSEVQRLVEKGPGTKADLPRADWPMMVRFDDINDPTSVERVDPDAAGITRIALETTDDPVTTGIEKRLPSFGRSSGFDAWYASLSMDDPRRVTLDDFRKGNEQ